MELPKQEEKILKFWKQIRAFEKSVENRSKGRSFVFYEGPPTANGRPGIHHVLSRAYKDIVCRYKTMQGYRVERKAGWDTHGLPVEIEVEKELGLKNKKDIEKYGIAKFNEKCRESVWRYKKEWDELTERIAFWLDLKDPYITYDAKYMESLWGIIKNAYEGGLLYEGHRVAPYCPRCGTSISSHEVALGYEDTTEDSVFVKFKIKNSSLLSGSFPSAHSRPPAAASEVRAGLEHANPALKSAEKKLPDSKLYLLAWTTTPWTLPGNVALAVGEKIKYVEVKQGGEYYILAKERLSILEGEYKVVKEFKGKELEGIEYEPLYDSLKEAKEKKHYVALADFVNTQDGTGIVHTAVMYGEDDYNLGTKLGLPKVHTVDGSGKFNKLVSKWQGKFVKDKDTEISIIIDLDSRNLLYKKEKYTHSYPFCWRCKTPLLYYAMQSWFIKMSSLRARLIKSNKAVNWVPSHIKDGRFGEWLREVKDWNFSRARYWGTPLPIWRCQKCGKYEVIGSRGDLGKQEFSTNTFYVLRHGEAEKNVENIIASRMPEKRKFHLTKKGEEQVQDAAKQLKRRGGVDYIFSSDFTRTKETAEVIAKELGLKVAYDKRLREYNLGIYDNRPEQEFSKDFPDLKERFTKRPRGGETEAYVQQRMFQFISAINKKYKKKKILIVGHGDPLWVVESRLAGFTLDEMIRKRKRNYPKMGQVRRISLKYFPYNTNGDLDLHRPYVDRIRFQCNRCKDKGCDYMERVEALADVWFDSGSMPFASSPAGYPADYICEAIDQTRGWFYTLLAVSTIMGKEAPYKNVISLGHVLDKNSKKMSKSLGNAVDPWSMIEKYGSDALRWYFYTINQPGDYKKFDEVELQKTYRKFVSTFANTLAFYQMYRSDKSTNYPLRQASEASKLPASPSERGEQTTNYLDKWIVSRLNSLMVSTAKKLDSYDITGAARDIESFTIDDLSNWYVRRSRKRFQNPESAKEKNEAEETLGYVLLELSKICAPFIPFLSEEVYQELQTTNYKLQTTSVHWEDFPKVDKKYVNTKLESDMQSAREIVEVAHEMRTKAGIRVRQPLAKLQISVALHKEILNIISEEVNVKKVIKGTKTSLDTKITGELKEEGFINEFMRHVQELRKAGGFVPHDKIELRYSTKPDLSASITRYEKDIKKQNKADKILEGGDKKEVFKAEGRFEWEGKEVWIAIKKLNIKK